MSPYSRGNRVLPSRGSLDRVSNVLKREGNSVYCFLQRSCLGESTYRRIGTSENPYVQVFRIGGVLTNYPIL